MTAQEYDCVWPDPWPCKSCGAIYRVTSSRVRKGSIKVDTVWCDCCGALLDSWNIDGQYIKRFSLIERPKMPDKPKTKKRPRDTNQLAKSIVDIATGEKEDREPTPEEQGKDPAAVSLGRRGGLKGGKARAASMTPKRRAEIAKKAAETRWKK